MRPQRAKTYEHSDAMRGRAHAAIPAGCHTYSKGDDQFPRLAPGFIVNGRGCEVLDVDGNAFLDWGMGLRSVILGHAYPRVVEAVIEQVRRGSNFTRPAPIEVEVAEQLIERIPCAEMVKFAKNGSDVTTAAVRLARAATGRDLVVFPREHPFYSFDDWFIGSTQVDAGVPRAVSDLSLTFRYNDLGSLQKLINAHPGQIAAVITEPATSEEPEPGFLEGLRELTGRNGIVLIFDEMITGLRWHENGAQAFYGVTPDLSTFGKAIGNGFSVSALVGRREIMELGGLHHDRPRVFLLSATHGGETHALVAARETIAEVGERGVGHLCEIGTQLQNGLNEAAAAEGVEGIVRCCGRPSSPNLVFLDTAAATAAGLRTLFLQETIARGVLMPYLAPSFSHTPADVERTLEAAAAALRFVRRVAEGEPIERALVGPAARPVFRRFNDDA
jgi:glutamate-1-semialdehyde 2,1-aminomutase